MKIDQSEQTEDLHFAAGNGDLKTVEALIDAGANIHYFDTLSYSALHYAVKSGNRQLVHRLLELGADVNSHLAGYAGETPITIAVEEGSFDITKLLLNYGADPYITGWMRLDALDSAEQRKDEKGNKLKALILREHPPSKERLKRDYNRG